MRPLVSIIILNYNGKNVLRPCLESVLRLAYSQVQIILVDNGSTDGSVPDALKAIGAEHAGKITLIRNERNLGYCDGFNVALPSCRGKYVMFLNNDTVLFTAGLEQLVLALEQHPDVGMVEGKIINSSPDYKDMVSSPLVSFSLGFFADGNLPRPGPTMYDDVREIFSPVGVWAVCRRQALEVTGAFDPVVFWGIDIRELSWRLWRAGFRVLRVPEAAVLHVGKLGTSIDSYPPEMADLVTFHTKKNQLYFLLKHISAWRVLVYIPLIAGARTVESMSALAHGNKRQLRALRKSIRWTLENLDYIARERRKMKSLARVPESYVFSILPKVSIPSLLFGELRLRSSKAHQN